MDKLEIVKKHIGKELRVRPWELENFEDGKCTLFYNDGNVRWSIFVELVGDKTKMVITRIDLDGVNK